MPWDKPYEPPRNKRLDPELYCRAGRVCFVTIRAYRNQSPFIRDDINHAIWEVLREQAEVNECQLLTYCIMPDHLHYLVTPRRDGVSVLVFTDRFKSRATNRSWKMGWRGKLWQPRFYDHIVRDEEDLLAIDQYIRENPVRKGLVDRAEDWPWEGRMNPLPI